MAGEQRMRSAVTVAGIPVEWLEDGFEDVERAREFLDEDPKAKEAIGYATRGLSQPVGFGRRAVSSVKGLLDSAYWGYQLQHPYTEEGQAAWGRALDVNRAILDYGGKAISHPSSAWSDIKSEGQKFNVSINPSATPLGATLSDELKRSAKIGANRGALEFDGASLAGGLLGLKGLTRWGAAAPLTDADYAQAGFTPYQMAEYGERYTNVGHHSVPKRVTRGWPKVIQDNPFFVVRRTGINKREMNEEHFRMDPHFFGAKAPVDPDGPKGWSGKKLGLKKYGPIDRVAFGTPEPVNTLLFSNWLGAPLGGIKIAGPEHGQEAKNTR